MIDLFVSDIDGCLAEPFTPYDLATMQLLAEAIATAGADGRDGWPPFTLCTGRPQPYVEAMTQALGLQLPALFEAGGGLFHPTQGQHHWSPHFDADAEAGIAEVRRWLMADVLPTSSLMLDHAKRTQAGVIGPDEEEVQRLVPRITAFADDLGIGFTTYHTPVSIDVTPRGITKDVGIAWLADELGVSLDRLAYIGDTGGDIDALRKVGFAFAPANANPEVKAVVDTVTEGAVLDGVLEAYTRCRQYNRDRSASSAA